MKSVVGNNERFSLLLKDGLVVLLTPHSNASIERVVFVVNKNKSEGNDRSRSDIEGCLLSILTVKLDGSESVSSCLDYDPDDSYYKQPKKAAVNYNKGITG